MRRIRSSWRQLVVASASVTIASSVILADEAIPATEPAVLRTELLGFLANDSTFTLLDARSAKEFEAAHLTAALNLPVDQFDEAVSMLPDDLHTPLVVYCKTGNRAAMLHAKLVAFGYRNVRMLMPEQIHWFDSMAVFNCGLPETERTPATLVGLLKDQRQENTK